MTLMVREHDGEGIDVPSREPADGLPGEAEILRRRNEEWLRDVEVGSADPKGRVRRKTVALIAAMYGLHPNTVRRGLAAARALRSAIQEDPGDDCG